VIDAKGARWIEFREQFEEKVNFLVEFIRVWKTIPVPGAFQD